MFIKLIFIFKGTYENVYDTLNVNILLLVW